MLIMSIFPFCHFVFKIRLLQMRHNAPVGGKGLTMHKPSVAFMSLYFFRQGTHPGGHDFDIQALVRGSFSTLDISPKDGALSESEWDAMLDIYNSNGINV